MAHRQHLENAVQGLRAFQDGQLSILRLSEPISAKPAANRASDASTLDSPSPASLEADLSHYKVCGEP